MLGGKFSDLSLEGRNLRLERSFNAFQTSNNVLRVSERFAAFIKLRVKIGGVGTALLERAGCNGQLVGSIMRCVSNDVLEVVIMLRTS